MGSNKQINKQTKSTYEAVNLHTHTVEHNSEILFLITGTEITHWYPFIEMRKNKDKFWTNINNYNNWLIICWKTKSKCGHFMNKPYLAWKANFFPPSSPVPLFFWLDKLKTRTLCSTFSWSEIKWNLSEYVNILIKQYITDF